MEGCVYILNFVLDFLSALTCGPSVRLASDTMALLARTNRSSRVKFQNLNEVIYNIYYIIYKCVKISQKIKSR